MSTPNFYITTPIYYVNDVPHLGHAYTTIAADAFARYQRQQGKRTWFLTGTDEHGQKIEDAATERGLAPKELADTVVERFISTWENLGCQHDDFIRTTDERHKRVVAEMWRRMEAAGDIYLGSYDGWYCVRCEAYYPEGQLVDGKQCPIHKSDAKWISEPSYFFKMSKYQDALLKHFEDHPSFVQPENYKNEIVSFIKSGLRDLSVSRTTFSWGIPVPGAPEHVIYVWIDALTNYISALGDIDGEAYRAHWPATCHLIGKDILRFHAVYWPCMLMSAGLPLPQTIFSHGWWTVRGEKISKSMPATRVDPNQLAADIGADALRYFLLREVPLGLDGDFSYESLLGRYNADLANDLGNLLNRTLSMTAKFTAGAIPDSSPALAVVEPHAGLLATARESIVAAAKHLDAYAPSRALEAIWRLVAEGNRYVDACQPWQIAKDPARTEELRHVTRFYLEAVYAAARMVAPVMPNKAREILTQLGLDEAQRELALSSWPDANAFGTELPQGLTVLAPEPIFPRFDDKAMTALLDRWIPADARQGSDTPATEATKPAKPSKSSKSAPKDTTAATVEFADFQKMDIRVAQVLAAEPVPKTTKLLKLQVDLGSERRQVIAGIAEAYAPETLVGKKVLLLANLAPATIRGVESQGMVLAAGDDAILGLSGVDVDVPPGTRVR